jgi:hypothetical protein
MRFTVVHVFPAALALSACGAGSITTPFVGDSPDGGTNPTIDGSTQPVVDGNNQPVFDGRVLPLPDASTDPSTFCSGKVTDKASRPFTALARPAVGAWVADPDFPGAMITRVTNAPAGEQITPVYSTVPAWNADGSLLLLYRWGSGQELYDAHTFARIGDLDCRLAAGGSPGPSDVEHVMWDPSDPDIIYFPSLYAPDNRGPLPILYRCNVRTHVATAVRDFATAPTNCMPGRDELDLGSDPQWYPGDLVGLQCGAGSSSWSGKKWIYDIRNDVVHTVRASTTAPFTDDLAPIAGASGTVAYYDGKVFDLELTQLRSLQIANPYEHATLGRSAANHDIYYAVDFDGSDPGAILAHDLQTGQRIPLMAESNGWGYPPTGVHLSAVVADPRAAGWVLASSVGEYRSPTETLVMELVLANVDTGVACRLGRHRSHGGDGPNGYQAEPHPTWHVLPDGTLEAVFASDWLGTNQVDSYLMRITP